MDGAAKERIIMQMKQELHPIVFETVIELYEQGLIEMIMIDHVPGWKLTPLGRQIYEVAE